MLQVILVLIIYSLNLLFITDIYYYQLEFFMHLVCIAYINL